VALDFPSLGELRPARGDADLPLAPIRQLGAPILKEPLQVQKSHVLIPDRPGTGIGWDEAAVARHAR
jgi:L-alanine-DL-glutamate epimerase-like enolase superfamily enzyme